MKRRVFAIAAGLSLLLFLATAFAWDYTAESVRVSDSFPYDGQEWEIRFTDGKIGIDNQPQIISEEVEFASVFEDTTREYQKKRGDFFKALHSSRRGSQAYRDAVAGMNRLTSDYYSLRARARPPGMTQPIEHSMSLMPVVAAAAVLPTIWLFIWLARHPYLRRELRNSASQIALLLSLVMVVALIRSYWAGATWTFDVHEGPPVNSAKLAARGYVWCLCRAATFSRARIEFKEWDSMDRAGGRHDPGGYSRGGAVDDIAELRSLHLPHLKYWSVAGIAYIADSPGGPATNGWIYGAERSIIIPAWIPLLLCLIYPAMRLRYHWRRRRRERRKQRDQCIACGYNLINNTSGVCPECGSAVPKEVGTNPARSATGG